MGKYISEIERLMILRALDQAKASIETFIEMEATDYPLDSEDYEVVGEVTNGIALALSILENQEN